MRRILLKYGILAILVTLAVISDSRACKIHNAITLPCIVAGWTINACQQGINGLVSSVLSTMIPVLLLFFFYLLRMLGAGDVKLFGAVGAIMGLEFVLYSMAYSFITGGGMALVFIILRRNGRQRLKHLLTYFKSCFLSRAFLPYTDLGDKTDGAKFPFAWAIACGTLIQGLSNF